MRTNWKWTKGPRLVSATAKGKRGGPHVEQKVDKRLVPRGAA